MKKRFRIFSPCILIAVVCVFLVNPANAQTNLLLNGDLETVAPAFWDKLNEGDGSSICSWDLATGHESLRSAKVEKTDASGDVVGWKSVDNAYLYWNHAKADRLYNLSFWAKTEGVNTDPASDDGKIGVLFQFFAEGTLLGEQFIPVDQSAASSDWSEYTDGLLIPAGTDPDEMYMTLMLGKEATGTVWFDDVGCGTDPWEMGPFNGNFETPLGWMEWHAADQGFSNTVNDTVHGGDWAALLHEWDDNDDEMVFYSTPAAVEPDTWYKISVWAKCDSVNSDTNYLPSNVIFDRDDNRLGMCFFYHKAPLEKSWDLTGGGDQFFYFDQRDSTSDWVQYNVISKSPEDAAGLSVRARFTSYPVGKVWYDDFAIEPLEILVTGVNDFSNFAKIDMPNEFRIARNYPNPFNPETTINYFIPHSGNIQIEIYNILGKKVKTLFDGNKIAGTYHIKWDGRDDSDNPLSTGIYIVALRSGQYVTTKRITLMK